jgi:hypothetical protein
VQSLQRSEASPGSIQRWDIEERAEWAYFVLSWIGFLGIGLPALSRKWKLATLLSVTALIGLEATAGRLLPIARRHCIRSRPWRGCRDSNKDDFETNRILASTLSRLAIGPGDQLGHFGHAIDTVYYAHMLGARVVAQVWEDPERIRV